MDSNQLRVAQHRAQIAANISGSVFGETIEKGEKISIEEFQERLEKGETFLAEPQINKFMRDNQEKVVNAYTPEEKEEIISKANNELSLLKSITVVNSIGQEFQFFTKSESAE